MYYFFVREGEIVSAINLGKLCYLEGNYYNMSVLFNMPSKVRVISGMDV